MYIATLFIALFCLQYAQFIRGTSVAMRRNRILTGRLNMAKIH